MVSHSGKLEAAYLTLGVAIFKFPSHDWRHRNVGGRSLDAGLWVGEQVGQGETAAHGGTDDDRFLRGGSNRLHQPQHEVSIRAVFKSHILTLSIACGRDQRLLKVLR